MILGGIALLVGLIWFLAGSQISHGTLFETYFSESVQGLEVGAAVKYRGVTIGRVTDIGLTSAEYGGRQPIQLERNTYRLVFVRYAVDTKKVGQMPDTSEAVSLGLRIRLASQGITGLSYLELDFVNPARYPAQDVPWQPMATYIPSMPSTFAQVQDAAQQVLAKLSQVDIDALATQVTGLLTDLRTDFAKGDVHQTLAEATALLRSTSEAVRAADLPGLTAEFRQTSTALRDTFQGEEMQKLLSQCRNGGGSAGHRGGATAGADRLGAGDGAARRQWHVGPRTGSRAAAARHAGHGAEPPRDEQIIAALSGAGVRPASTARRGGADEAALGVGGRGGADRLFVAAEQALCAAA